MQEVEQLEEGLERVDARDVLLGQTLDFKQAGQVRRELGATLFFQNCTDRVELKNLEAGPGHFHDEVVEKVEALTSAPPVWTMWREARG